LASQSNPFPVQLKLSAAADYQKAFQGKIKLVVGNIKLFARPNDMAHARLGLAVSRKKTKNAVMRNRIKRIVRESFRLHQQEITSHDLVIIILRKEDKVDNKKLHTWLNTLWQQLSKA
jgi:ribonuclease P protein component